MSQTEITSSVLPENIQDSQNGAVSALTRKNALDILRAGYGESLLKAMMGPIQGAIGYIVNNASYSPRVADELIRARTEICRLNAANDDAFEEKKAV